MYYKQGVFDMKSVWKWNISTEIDHQYHTDQFTGCRDYPVLCRWKEPCDLSQGCLNFSCLNSALKHIYLYQWFSHAYYLLQKCLIFRLINSKVIVTVHCSSLLCHLVWSFWTKDFSLQFIIIRFSCNSKSDIAVIFSCDVSEKSLSDWRRMMSLPDRNYRRELG